MAPPARPIDVAAPTGIRGVLAHLRTFLPEGQGLPEKVWLRRHHALLGLLWIHAIGLPIYGLIQGYGTVHSLQEGGVVALIAALATMAKGHRRLAAALVAVGLMTGSAVLVHLSGGVIEAHFHFFVMIALLALYEDWVPFLLAAGYVVLHHGITGVLDPEAVYNHPDALANPWKWAGIHGAFVTAAGIAGVVAWRLNEEARSETQAAEANATLRAAQQARVARLGASALAGAELPELMSDAVDAVTEMLRVDIAAVMELEPGGDELRARAAVGLPRGAVAEMGVRAGTGSQAGFAVASDAPVVVEDWAEETRFAKPPVLRAAGAVSGATVPIRSAGETYGVLGAQTLAPRRFSSEDLHFLQSVANVLASAIERQEAEERIRHQALHDPLTGLPNRGLFLDRLGHALTKARRNGHSVAVLFGDLDRFKLVNDSLGHEIGDNLLRAVAPRLRDAIREADTVSRFGGDEFGILVEEVESELDATHVAERVAGVLARPFVVDGREHFVSTSLGIAIGEGGELPEALIRDADAAMYRAKSRGGGGYEIFDEVMRARALDHLRIENDLRRAVERDELRLHYQPMVSLPNGEITAVEALVRWQHPERGLIAPGEFISIAEEGGLIVPVGRWVLEEACRQAAAWHAARPDAAPIAVSVNLSARELAQPELAGEIANLIAGTGIEPGRLSLEITEGALIEETAALISTMRDLKALGCRLLLDDFGTGFSSLGYLKRFPLDGIKIDRSFVERLGEEPTDVAIIRAIVRLGEDLDLSVIAEGVETASQVAEVTELGCGSAQGFWFTPPVPADRMGELLDQPRPWRHEHPAPASAP